MYNQQIIDLYHSLIQHDLRQSPFDASSPATFASWQRRARRQLRAILGAMPATPVPLDLQRTPVADTPQYTQERLVYTTRPGLQVPAYLFTPKGVRRRVPAVLALHGHSKGGKDETIDDASIYHGFARRLAEQGVVVLCPDQIGFGERALPPGPVTYDVLTHGLNMLGHTLIGVRYYDLVRALDLLQSLPQVNPRRLGVMGLSLGGEMTLFLSALDRRVSAACICGYVTSHLHTFLDRPHCTCGHLRDLAKHFEHVDLAALIAPRPLFLDSGTADPSFPTADAQSVVAQLRPIYDLYNKPQDDLGLEIHPGAHEINGTQSLPWLLRHLR